MTQIEANDLATQLLGSYGAKPFEISMPDRAGYEMMRTTFANLGRETGPDGEFFIVKVFALAGPPSVSA